MGVPRDEHERTFAFADIALGQIKALAQAAIPRNFEIWYNYATGYNPALNQLINQTLEQKGTLGEADLEEIYATYIATSRATDRIDTVNSRMLGEIKQVLDTIDAATGTATNYSASLADATASLKGANDGEGLRAVVERLVKGAKDMELNNKKLEARLSASKQEIEQLQENLQAVRTESLTDPLTTLSNRKFFDQALAKAMAEAKESNQPLSLLMADIDHFKSFNDKFGHLTGDQVLRLVALSVKQNVKGQDVAARYGGEEFVIALPNTALQSANHGGRPYPPRRHDQGIDETLERRAARPGDDLDRRRGLTPARYRAVLDRTRRHVPLRRQAQRPQSRDLRGRSRGAPVSVGAGGVSHSQSARSAACALRSLTASVPLRGPEWRGPRSYLVGGFERDPAPIQKQAEHIKPADHKHDLARDRLTVLV